MLLQNDSSWRFDRILNMPQILNMPGFWICFWFWICEGSGYTTVLLCQGKREFWIYLNNSLGCLIMCLNEWICLDGFCFTFLTIIIPYLNHTLSCWKVDLWFFLLYLEVFDFLFCFRLNIFTSKISNLLLPLGAKGLQVVNLTKPVRYPVNISTTLC